MTNKSYFITNYIVKPIIYYILCILFIIGFTHKASAQNVDKPVDNPSDRVDNHDKNVNNSGFVPIALPFYMPETTWGVGFYLLYYKNQDNNHNANPDETTLYGTYTLKNQVSIGITTDQYLNLNRYKLSGAVEFSRYPNIFWGIGPNTKNNDDEDFTSQMVMVRGSFLVNLANKLFIGPAYVFKSDIMKHRESNGLLDQNTINGSDGTTISSVGININWDMRDSVFFPTRGFYLDAKGFVNRKELGNEYNFYQLQTDIRYYHQFLVNHILGLQLMTDFTSGTVPMQAMHRLGGDMMLRGYYQGRYRDRNFYGVQTEYRFPVYWRFTGTLFAGIGQVAPEIADLMFKNELKISYGLGIRFIADEQEHIPVRFDVGFDKEKNANFYLTVKEAF